MPSGGPRTPNNPAAVSGPGALSQRTDGGPGAKQPIRVPTGGAYGEAKATASQQAAAPMAAGEPPVSGRIPAVAATPGAGTGAFGPSRRPNEPIMSGVPNTSERTQDAKAVLRMIYDQYPSPWIAALLND